MSTANQAFPNKTHENKRTGCVIWDGDMDRLQRPVVDIGVQKMKVRDAVWSLSRGEAPPKGAEVITDCDNPRCVLETHLQLAMPEKAPSDVHVNEDELAQVKRMFAAGYRHDKIAEVLNTSRPRITKLLKIIREREASETPA